MQNKELRGALRGPLAGLCALFIMFVVGFAPEISSAVAARAKAKAKAATPTAQTAVPAQVAAAPVAKTAQTLPNSADWREIDPENAIVMDTTKGRIIIELAPEMAPNHTMRIKELSRMGFYNGLNFHRVIEGFMAQGGDPKGDGTGDSPLSDLNGEFSFRRGVSSSYVKAMDKGPVSVGWLGSVPVTSQSDVLMARTVDGKVSAWGNHCPSVTSMARSSAPNSANSQFFLMRNYTQSLDRTYTVWGRAVVGLDVIRALKTGEPVINPDKMTNVQVLADIAPAQRPKIFIERAEGASFQAKVQAAILAKGAAFSNCDLMPNAQVIAPN